MRARLSFRTSEGDRALKRKAILTINTGSSSIKLSAYEASGCKLGDRLLSAIVTGFPDELSIEADTPNGPVIKASEVLLRSTGDQAALVGALAKWAAESLQDFDVKAIGHRVVHGGLDFVGPVLATANVVDRLRQLTCLAPTHQPYNLDGIDGISRMWPELFQTVSFDTAFHRTQPRVAQLYAIPKRLSDEGLVRFGFHGLSYKHVARQLEEREDTVERARVVAAHLGSGASVCAMMNGKSIATSMGLTALDGIPMSTRSGSVDPGLLLHLLLDRGVSARDLSAMLYRESGLLGVSGVSGDVRRLLESSDSAAAEALDLYAYRIAREIGSLATALQGMDALVFTGGVGENSAPVRQMVCEHLAWLGVQLDLGANEAGHSQVQASDSDVQILVVPANEEAVIAQEALSVIGAI